MTDKTIRAGDLVMVVKPTVCCGNTKDIGTTFIVAKRDIAFGSCMNCGTFFFEADACFLEDSSACHVLRLIKIDPPALPESIQTSKDMEIPA